MKKIFLLWHIHTDIRLHGGENVKLLGTFSTPKKAEQAKTKAALLDGFKDHLEGFEISEYNIDQREWREGFHTETWGSVENKYFIGEVGHWIVIDGKIKKGSNYEHRTLMVMAKNVEEASLFFEKEALTYSPPYKNVYGQNVCYIFDRVHFVRELWFFDTQKLDKGAVVEVDSRVKTRKVHENTESNLNIPELPKGDGLYDLLALWKRFAQQYADNETYIYEWQNDMDVRYLIDKKLTLLDTQSKNYFLKTSGLRHTDKLVLAKTFEVNECIWGEQVEKERRLNRKKHWYYYRLNQAIFENEKGIFTKKY